MGVGQEDVMIGNRRRVLGGILLLGALLFGIACGGSDSGDNGGGGDPLNPSSGDSGAQSGDLRLLGSDPLTLDPALVFETSSAGYVLEIFSGLLRIDNKLQIVPDLAEAMPDVSADGKTYTFKIRRDAQFHDGRPVTAEDFKYSLDRAAKLGQTDSVVAEAFLGDIVGAKDVTRGRANSISGVEVVDSSTLKITIDAPKPYFLAKLTYTTAFVVDKQQVESNPRNWTRKPNGTGPYKLQEWRVNERIILTANEKFYDGAPAVKRVLYNLAGGSALTQYENNEIDWSPIGTNDIERVQSTRDALNKDYKSGPNLSLGYIAFNTTMAPFDDPKVRQAFEQAIDREQLSRVVLKGMLPPANSFMMPGLPGYNENAKLPPFDPAAAKQLLAESKYKDAAGLGTVTLTEAGGGANVGFSTQAILEMWKQNLGVDVQIAQAEEATFYDDVDRGRLQMWSVGWIMDYPDPENLLDLLFFSTSRKNESRYNNPAYDQLIVQARTELDSTKRIQLYQQAEQILIQDMPWIPLTYGMDHYVVKPYVKGFDPVPALISQLRYVSIEK
jgi:oligopeptide transport system substrate-binding protein